MRLRSERKPMIGDKFCFTEDHEILTENGWISISKYVNRYSENEIKIACIKD